MNRTFHDEESIESESLESQDTNEVNSIRSHIIDQVSEVVEHDLANDSVSHLPLLNDESNKRPKIKRDCLDYSVLKWMLSTIILRCCKS